MADKEGKWSRLKNKSHITMAFVFVFVFHLLLGCIYPLWYFNYDCSIVQKELYNNYTQLSDVLKLLKDNDSEWDGRYAYSGSSFLNYEIITQEYVAFAKKIQILGVKYLIFDEKYDKKTDLINYLNEIGYERCAFSDVEGYVVLVKTDASLKISHTHKETLVIGKNVEGIIDSFPYFSYSSRGLFDYSVEELSNYKMLYYVPDDIETVTQKEKAEEMLKELSAKGTMVIIEPLYDKHINLFDIHMEYKSSGNMVVLYATNDAPANFPKVTILESQKENVGTFFGTSSHNLIPYVMMQNGNTAQERIVFGSLKFDNAQVFFVGNRLSEYLLSVYVRSFGPNGKNYSNAIVNSSRVKVLYNELVSYRGINRDIYFDDVDGISNLNVYGDNINYGKKSFLDAFNHVIPTKIISFDYDLDADTDILISKLYDRHYRAYIDGKRIKVNDCEDVINVSLISGKHSFDLVHMHSIPDMIVIFLSCFGVLSLIIDLIFFKRLNKFYEKLLKGIIEYLNKPCVGANKPHEFKKIKKKADAKKKTEIKKKANNVNGPYVYVRGKGTHCDLMLTYEENQSEEESFRKVIISSESVKSLKENISFMPSDEVNEVISEAKPLADFNPRKYKTSAENIEEVIDEDEISETLISEEQIVEEQSFKEEQLTEKTVAEDSNIVLEIETTQINDESEEKKAKKKKITGNILHDKLNEEQEERMKDIEIFVLKS